MDDRLVYHPDEKVLCVNFEGMSLDTVEDVDDLAEYLDRKLASYGRRLNVVVNSDNFSLNPRAADRFFEMIRHNRDHYLLSSRRYSTNAFFRHQLGEEFAAADLEPCIYPSFDEARRGL